jgi:phosphoglycolate phosphatase-like HAD superfamily hydrolase
MTETKYHGTIVLDFDGVIHRYSKGYHDGTCYDKPKKGAVEAIAEFQKQGYSVVILSARKADDILKWLEKHQAPFKFTAYADNKTSVWDHVNTVLVTSQKLRAKIYVDDCGYYFSKYGKWNETKVKSIIEQAERK